MTVTRFDTMTSDDTQLITATNNVGISSCVVIGNRVLPRLNWTRLNYREEDHDNRRLLEHRARDCQCEVCFLELNKLPKRMGWFSQIGVVKTYRPEYFYFYAKFLRMLMVFIQLGGPRGISVHVVWTGPLSFRHQLTLVCMSYKFSNFM